MAIKISWRERPETGAVVAYLTGSHLGVRVKRSLGTEDHREARRLADKLIPIICQEIAAGTYESGSFGDVADAYLRKVGKDRRFIEPLIAAFGRHQINTIADQDVHDWADSHDWTPQTKNRQALTPFCAVANFGAKLRPPRCRPRKIEPYAAPHVPVTVAPHEWIRWVVEYSRERGFPWIAAQIFFQWMTAARAKEAANLMGGDYSPETGKALLRMTKNGRPRVVTVPRPVRDAIALLDVHPDRPIFRYATPQGCNKQLKRLCREAGMPFYSSHKWGRHRFAADMLAAGHPIQTVQMSGGWSSIKVLLDNYGHFEKTHAERAVLGTFDAVPTDVPTAQIENQKSTKSPVEYGAAEEI